MFISYTFSVSSFTYLCLGGSFFRETGWTKKRRLTKSY